MALKYRLGRLSGFFFTVKNDAEDAAGCVVLRSRSMSGVRGTDIAIAGLVPDFYFIGPGL